MIQGLNSIQSSFGPKETMDRVEAKIETRRLNVFARLDHRARPAEVRLTLAPTELIIFGNTRGGTPLMQSVQTAGIDLPLKMLVWQDSANKTWISFNGPSWIAQRHSVAGAESTIDKMANLLSATAREAAGGH
jgi:uncharacterized protein (DUF302 family)